MTLRCLTALHEQKGHGAEIRTVLVDDGSTDGTAAAVAEAFPDVEILEGDGTLWWNGAMQLGLRHARRTSPDHILWLNDDTVLDPDALRRLLASHDALRDAGHRPIVVGSTRDPADGSLTYGGVERRSWLRPMRFELVAPGSEPREALTMNGNCVLVPADVLEATGNLDPAFRHSMGDYDYGLRARLRGASIWIAPGTVGTCRRNPPRWDHGDAGEVWQRLRDRRGIPPDEWRVFTRRWAGPLWPIYFVSPYVRRLAAALRRTVTG